MGFRRGVRLHALLPDDIFPHENRNAHHAGVQPHAPADRASSPICSSQLETGEASGIVVDSGVDVSG
jgi:hypothetical protein